MPEAFDRKTQTYLCFSDGGGPAPRDIPPGMSNEVGESLSLRSKQIHEEGKPVQIILHINPPH